MDFFAHQEAARRATARLVVYFALAVVTIVIAVYLVTWMSLVAYAIKADEEPPLLWEPTRFVVIALLTLGAILAGSLYKIAELRGGGGALASMLGGRAIDPATKEPVERRLLNVVEEMALASGVPVPEVWVLDNEKGINAFAAGFSPQDAVIGVTDGTLRMLSRDELQGVLAHEFSHLLNGDMRLNLRLIGLLHGILVLALIGYTILRSLGRSRARGKKGGAALLAIALFSVTLILVGYVGVVFGRMIKSALSRQREFLADAAAVQFTRNPVGLSGALQKIGGYRADSRLSTAKAEEASHLFFSNALARGASAAFATHPPLDERIRRIDPSWKGGYPKVDYPARGAEEEFPASAAERSTALLGMAVAVATTPAAESIEDASSALAPDEQDDLRVTPEGLATSVGTLSEEHLAYAARLLESLPERLRAEAHEPDGAQAIVFALLLDRDLDARESQLGLLQGFTSRAAFVRTLALQESVAACPPEARLPLVDLALPALGRLPLGRYQAFSSTIDALIASDRRVELFELVLKRLLQSHLARHFEPRPLPAANYYKLDALGRQCSVLLSALADSGHAGHDEDAGRAFARAAAELPGTPGLVHLPPGTCALGDVDRALADLKRTTPKLKRVLLRAAAAAVISDGRVTLAEGELLRAIADALGCPVPPFLPGQVVA
jgi:Zn-dependent protease with chaperone function